MTRYVVFEPPVRDGSPAGAASERAVFVRDGFSIWAFLFPWAWLLRYGLLLSAILVFLALGGLGWLAGQGLGGLAAVAALLLSVLVALEGPSLRGRRLRRKRYAETGAFQAANADEASVFYYAEARNLAGPTRAGNNAGPKGLPWRFERSATVESRHSGSWRSRTGG